ncbi:glycosyl hydrolase [Sphingobium yanoikuyae]|uniref:glycosyl hydrolase n=1 Tax=Sphingobium yanoikuyae TaxID=13690 RepID=UPI0022DDAD6D|nr:glycosyl hydrolase [Sphingobium yanoikuyae]WBQ19282.1 glycosyl hydrolase [Sphingobium yanoikuyae]
MWLFAPEKSQLRHRSVGLGALAMVLVGLGTTAMKAEPSARDTLLEGFETPPPEARPRLWWHWMGGNISAEGARLDLEWMQRIGIGGVHAFSGGKLPTPAVVKPAIPFMSDQWQAIFNQSLRQAHDAGFEFGIAGSPGWSETGGPWVVPADGMKKYVWSETQVVGGRPFRGRLALPPQVTGPFQEIEEGRSASQAYGDTAVIAFPTPRDEQDAIPARIEHVGMSGRSPLTLPVPADRPLKLGFEGAGGVQIEISYRRPVRLGAFTIGLREDAQALLEAQAGDGRWIAVAQASIEAAGDQLIHPAPQETTAFTPVAATRFRLKLTPQTLAASSALGEILPKKPVGSFTITRLAFLTGGRVNGFEAKAGFQSTISEEASRPAPVARGDAVPQGKVIWLTDRLRADGSLDWTPPAGRWTIVRMGWSLTGAVNAPAEPGATGLEVDKLDRAAVTRYLDHYLGLYEHASGGCLGPAGIGSMLTDSWEAGVQNWTPAMLAEFRTRQGYDPVPYLPVLTGRVVGNVALSEAFLFDFRKNLKEMVAENHHAVLARSLHARGMTYYSEAQGDFPRAIVDGMALKARSDIPTAEYWYRPFSTGPGQPTLRADLKESASVAHVYGKKLAAAEALTVAAIQDPWSFSPAMLRPVADRIFASGINRLLLHESHHQPLVDAKPGLSLFIFGQYFNRNESWAEQAGPWITYLGRTSHMLQQGQPIADIAYFYGEERSLSEQYVDRLETDIPAGHDYDYVGPEALLSLLSVRDGKIVTPSGMRYRFLYVPDRVRRFTLPALQKIEALVRAGGLVVAQRPLGGLGVMSPDAEIERITARLWGRKGRGRASDGQGAAQVYATIAQAIDAARLTPDIAFATPEDAQSLLWQHRRDGQTDIYFLSNQAKAARDISLRFRVTGRAPELWKADSGRMTPLSYRQQPDGVDVSVSLAPEESAFVVFPSATRLTDWTAPRAKETPLMQVEGPWLLAFEPGRGAPPTARFDKLVSWPQTTDPGIRYFSGSARYIKEVDLAAGMLRTGRRIQLDLGTVHEIATVRVNDMAFPPQWHSPYRLDVTHALRPGRNRLEISVVNLWPNRLIGDKQPGARPVAFAPSSPYRANSPLLPSGLLGPVRLVGVEQED